MDVGCGPSKRVFLGSLRALPHKVLCDVGRARIIHKGGRLGCQCRGGGRVWIDGRHWGVKRWKGIAISGHTEYKVLSEALGIPKERDLKFQSHQSVTHVGVKSHVSCK